MKSGKPTSVRIRMYQVGFGDCFLLTYRYAAGPRHVLIDFGSTRLPNGVTLEAVAEDIVATCGKEPVAIVATHRHKDHLEGFDKAWPSVAKLNVSLVVQPWTEEPDLPADAREPAVAAPNRVHVAALATMHDRAAQILAHLGAFRGLDDHVREEIAFVADDNLGNAAAVKNLASFGAKCRYVKYGDRGVFDEHLPGVDVRVLGPPTISQQETLTRQAKRHDEYWYLRAPLFLGNGSGPAPEPGAPPLRPREVSPPFHATWLQAKLDQSYGEELLGIVRSVDNAMNNTSVILLFDVGRERMLFPGDAQIENWSYALSFPEVRELLGDVTLYKVGHHGSMNGTPKSVWSHFRMRAGATEDNRLATLLSTLPGVHGSPQRATEVPRLPLLHALKTESQLLTTNGVAALYLDHEVPLR